MQIYLLRFYKWSKSNFYKFNKLSYLEKIVYPKQENTVGSPKFA